MIATNRERLLALCNEYAAYVAAQKDGQHDADENHAIGGQRTLVHDELCRLLHIDRSVHMPSLVRRILSPLYVEPESSVGYHIREALFEARLLGFDQEQIAALFAAELERE